MHLVGVFSVATVFQFQEAALTTQTSDHWAFVLICIRAHSLSRGMDRYEMAAIGCLQGGPCFLRFPLSWAGGQIKRNWVGGAFRLPWWCWTDCRQCYCSRRRLAKEEGGGRTGRESIFRLPGGEGSRAMKAFQAAGGGEEDSSISEPPCCLLCLAVGLCDWTINLCPLGMLSKCQALMRFPTMLRDTCEAWATHSKSPAGCYIYLSL